MDEIVKVAGDIYREEAPIRIGFIGNVRYYNENVKLLEILKMMSGLLLSILAREVKISRNIVNRMISIM